MLTRLMDKLNKYNLIDELKNLQIFLNEFTIELIKQYGKVNSLYIETSQNSKEEKAILKYFVKILEFFIISITSSIGISIFTENSIE